jgi:small multidrug resistance pump
VVFFYITSLVFFNFALKKIEIGGAYAIWSGVGTALLVCVGHFLFAEPLNWIKVFSIILIVLGVIGLHLGGSAQDVRFK